MRSGRVTAFAGLVLLAAGCSSPGVIAGFGSAPSASPAHDAPQNSPQNSPLDPQQDPAGQTAQDGTVSATTADPGGAGNSFRTTPSDGPTPSTAPGATNRPTPARLGDDPVRVPPPKVSSFTYVFPVAGCKVTYTRKLLVLPKTTIWAKKGCRFVAPIDGTVHEVNSQDRWSSSTDRGADREGRFVAIIGADGVRYLGGHLDSIADGIRPGVKVKAGQELGRVGNSGNAAGDAPNLYFAVSWESPAGYWWVRRGMVKPWKYLDAWYDGNRTYSPRREMLRLRKRMGATPQCTVLCTGRIPSTPTQQPKPKPKPTKKEREEPPILIGD